MRFSVSEQGRRVDLEARHHAASTTLGDLLTPMTDRLPARLLIDGQDSPLDAALTTVRDGAELEFGRPAHNPAGNIVAELHALAGPAAGQVWRLVAGKYSVGSSSDVRIQLPDAPTFGFAVGDNGDVIVDGFAPTPGFWAGPHHLQFVQPSPPIPRGRESRLYFNRPPRPRRANQQSLLEAPTRGKVQGRSRRMSAITLTLPVLTGVLLALVFHRVMFLAFALMSPVMMIGNAWEDRRRRKRETAEVEETFAAELAEFAGALAGARSTAVAERYGDVPSVAGLVSRADAAAISLWERRPDHQDFAHLAVGYGEVEWDMPIKAAVVTEPEVAKLLESHRALGCGPLTIDLSTGRSVGIVGEPHRRQAIARTVVAQAATLHGPADLRIGVVTDQPTEWDWVKWLPHTCLNGGTELRLLAANNEDAHHTLGFLRAAPAEGGAGPLTTLIIDHADLDDELRKLVTDILAGTGRPVAGVILADDVAGLPSRCTHVVDVEGPNAAVWQPGRANEVAVCRPIETPTAVAAKLAQRLSHLDDPEAVTAGAGLADSIRLLDVLAMTDPTPEDISARWGSAEIPRLCTPVGATEGGTLTIDLESDGPHGLLAGTTGSGKSEFLRTLVAGLAAQVDPDHLNFVLIDYKGGAAFDVCEDLPHVVGLVTDLDEHLSRRALICLEAELHYREERLRDAGVASIVELWRSEPEQPLPRLAVIVDEFATLASELPDFMDALVDIAQRGRSLGVHMMLATQRPAGIVKDSIRANTNLRVSLRVQTAADSKDVLNAPDAARISRSHPGRGFVRLGPGELIPFQTALVSGRGDADSPRLTITPFVFGMRQPEPAPTRIVPDDEAPTDLARLVEAIRAANDAGGYRPARRPWPDPLPDQLTASQLDLESGDRLGASIGLVDLPDRQRQDTWRWDPTRDGNLLLAGMAVNGPGTVALTALAELARQSSPDDLHLYGIDHGTGELAALDGLAHTGAIVPADSVDRQIRVIEFLRREIDHRRSTGRSTPTIVFALDGLSGFRSTFEDPALLAYRDRLQEVVAAGPARGIYSLLTADQGRAVPGPLSGVIPNRLVFGLADRFDYSALGISGTPPELGPGRAIDAQSGLMIQTVTDPDESMAAADEWAPATITPDPIATLGPDVALPDIVDAGQITDRCWEIPIGIDDRLLAPVTVSFYDGDHFLVAGPRRSGRSTALATAASAVRKLSEQVQIVAVAGPRSPLTDHPAVDRVLAHDELESLGELAGPSLVLVDDADDVDDPDGVLTTLLGAVGTGIHVVAAGRADVIRSLPRHWTRAFRSGRRGFVLQPADAADGDILGARLPRAAAITTPGRGYFVDGTPILVQIARD